MTTIWYSIARGGLPGPRYPKYFTRDSYFTWATWKHLPELSPITRPAAFGGAMTRGDARELVMRGHRHDTHFERIGDDWCRAWRRAIKEQATSCPVTETGRILANVEALQAQIKQRACGENANPLQALTVKLLDDLGVETVVEPTLPGVDMTATAAPAPRRRTYSQIVSAEVDRHRRFALMKEADREHERKMQVFGILLRGVRGQP